MTAGMVGQIHLGDCRTVMARMDPDSVQCVVTSPPYFGLRDYGVEGQIGLESRPDCLGWATGAPCGECFVCQLVDVFDAVHRVLRPDGTVWMNLGDSYSASGRGGSGEFKKRSSAHAVSDQQRHHCPRNTKRTQAGWKDKDLMGMPWRVALALQARGWWLRQEIIWAKPNPMPESVRDRCTKSHEHIFLLAKSERYYFDAEAIAEPITGASLKRLQQDVDNQAGSDRAHQGERRNGKPMKAVGSGVGWGYAEKDAKPRTVAGKVRRPTGWANGTGRGHLDLTGRYDPVKPVDGDVSTHRNKRSVWEIPTQKFSEAHFATFPERLAATCILAGSRPGDLVMDPFMGSGTVAVVAKRLGRPWVGIDLKDDYRDMAMRRIEAQPDGLSLA